MRSDSFTLLQGLLKQESGLVVTPDKMYLLESRLMPVARKWQLTDLDALAGQVRTRRDAALVREVTEAMTTNESSFFRDSKPFEQFRQSTLPQLLQARAATRRLRIWSAACSTGQEPYSLAMVLREESAKLSGWTVEIVGTDLSTEVLDKARAGQYSQFEVQRGLPITHLVKHFKQVGDKWELSPQIRGMVEFRCFNLLNDLTPLGRFDVVFCRNVLIYFDEATKRRVLESMGKLMPADGVLYLGGAETVLGITNAFKPIDGQRGTYQLAAGSAAPAAAPRSFTTLPAATPGGVAAGGR